MLLLEREMHKYRIAVELDLPPCPPAMVVGNQIQQVASGVKEDLEDITAEASAEIRTKDAEISPPLAGTETGDREN